ncbi:MAG: 3-phosphoshikimate 1-carboxyvinyltransferase [Candidatus Puniceispirillaceae bacterium]
MLKKQTLVSSFTSGLNGLLNVPGDKSISHRSLIIAGMAIGQTEIRGLLRSEDVLSTLCAMRQLGVTIEDDLDKNVIAVKGVGTCGFNSPEKPLDLGNSGTGVRLLMGAIAGQPLTARLTGDVSLSARPMKRITDPLQQMGAQIGYLPKNEEKGLLPVTITGANPALPLSYSTQVASAQIKSAIMLAGLNARGVTIISEPYISRDHTESMLRHFGVEVEQRFLADGRHQVTLAGEANLKAKNILVPRDPSSAAFAIVAALITPESDITLPAVGMNPQRIGLITTLIEMGADLDITNERLEGGEPVGDIHARSSKLNGIEVPAKRAASMIDEYPILSVAASCAQGRTYMPGIAELRVKETDRIAVMARGLKACGVSVDEQPDSLTVDGQKQITGGTTIASQHDHRIAMSFLVLGMVSQQTVSVIDTETIATSFPQFASLMNGAGANIYAPEV